MSQTRKSSAAPKQTWRAHPFAEFFPLIEGEEFDALVADIKAQGQRETALVDDRGRIIDGRNRARACDVLGIPLKTKRWDGKGSLAAVSVSLNLRRRHLTPSQRAAAALGVKEQYAIEAAERQKATQRRGNAPVPVAVQSPEKGEAAELAARDCGVSARYIYMAETVRKHNRKLFDQVVSGRVKLSVANRAAQRAAKLTRHAEAVKSAAPLDASQCRIVKADCLKMLEALPARSARLIFADPPYNCGKDYGNGSKADQLSPAKFRAWCDAWIGECQRVLAADGSIFVMIDGANTNMIGALLDDRLHRRNLIVWHETFGNYTADNYTACARFIHYYTKDADRCVFNGDSIRVPSDRQAKYGDRRADPLGKVPGNVWQFPRLVDNATERMPGFPTQVPLALVERIVLAHSEPGDLVVDPFVGTGTTAVAAVTHGRKFTGSDRNPTYVKAASERVALQIAALAARRKSA